MYLSPLAMRELVEGLGPRTREAVGALLPGPVTLVVANPERRYPLACREDPERLGVRLIGGPLAGAICPLFQTSANRSGEPAPASFGEVPAQIVEGADLAIDGGALTGLPSTVVDLTRFDTTASGRSSARAACRARAGGKSGRVVRAFWALWTTQRGCRSVAPAWRWYGRSGYERAAREPAKRPPRRGRPGDRRGARARAAAPAGDAGDDRLRELRPAGGAGSGRLGADQQVRRGLPGQPLLRRLRGGRRRRAAGDRPRQGAVRRRARQRPAARRRAGQQRRLHGAARAGGHDPRPGARPRRPPHPRDEAERLRQAVRGRRLPRAAARTCGSTWRRSSGSPTSTGRS